jgi:hypothetical protein
VVLVERSLNGLTRSSKFFQGNFEWFPHVTTHSLILKSSDFAASWMGDDLPLMVSGVIRVFLVKPLLAISKISDAKPL